MNCDFEQLRLSQFLDKIYLWEHNFLYSELTFCQDFLIRIRLYLPGAIEPADFVPLRPSLSRYFRDLLLHDHFESFPAPIFLCGTSFQKKVWAECLKIKSGNTITYGQLAKRIGINCPQAVGQALKANPLPIIIPCHRVIGKAGRLTGYSSGLEIKRLLLDIEAGGGKNAYSNNER